LQFCGILAAHFFCVHLLAPDHAGHEGCRDRQLGGGQAESLACQRFVHAIHLVQNLARLNLCNVVFRRALAVTHTHFGRLTRNRLVRENADPDATATFDVTRHGAPCRFDLACSQTTTTNGLETEVAKAYVGATGRHTGITAFLFLAEFSSSWLQHVSLLISCRACPVRLPRAVHPG